MRKLLFLLIGIVAAFLAVDPALAQTFPEFNVSVDDDLLSSERIFQMFVVLTVLSLAPSILMMVTSFTRLVIVFSFLRTAMGLQSTPPNTVLISLALFLTFFIMSPTLEAAYQQGISPYLNEEISEDVAFERSVQPFHKFMVQHAAEKDISLFINMLPENQQDIEAPEDVPLKALIPAFMISELKRAFEIGFLIFLPFLVIDLAVASILMSMGMMMLPPVIISLPFKVVFFVLVDGWHLLVGSLVESFKVPPV